MAAPHQASALASKNMKTSEIKPNFGKTDHLSSKSAAIQTPFRLTSAAHFAGGSSMFGQRHIDHNPGTHYRSERVSAVNGQYFFSTREGTLEGPYFNRTDAEREIAFYIRRMKQANEIIESRAF
jgi:hypothetical protein